MATPSRISGAWPCIAVATIATIAWAVTTFPAYPARAFGAPAMSIFVLPTVLLMIAGGLGLRRGRDWRTAITMMAIPPSIGVLGAAAFGLLQAPTIPTWPAVTVLLSIVAIGIGLLAGTALRSLRHRMITARS